MCPDPTSLEHQVINNLISNAIKFSFVGGEIIVTVAGNNGSITSCVRDYGTGMPDDVLHKIFDTREPTTRVGTANEKGTGFAMPVVHSYIELYGGKISVKSWPPATHPKNSGTEIVISFRSASAQEVAIDMAA